MADDKTEKLDTAPLVEGTKVDDTVVDDTKVDDTKEVIVGDSIDDFTKLLNSETVAEDRNIKEEVLKDEKKEEVELEVKKEEVKVEDKTVAKKNIPASAKPESRDYSGIDEKIVPLLKSMSGSAFDYVKPLIAEHAKLKTEHETAKAKIVDLEKGIVKIPDSYNEHPRAYTLTPDFEKTADNLRGAAVILEHWENQLAKVRNDEDTYTVIQIDPKSGEFYESAPIKIDATSEKTLMQYVAGSHTQLARFKVEVQNIAKSHKTGYDNAVADVKDFEEKSFANFNGENKEKLAPLVADMIKTTFPPAFQSNPLAPGYAKALLTINHLATLLKKLNDGKGKTTEKKDEKTTEKKTDVKIDDDQRRAGPTSSHMNGDGGDKGGAKKAVGDDISDFEAVK